MEEKQPVKCTDCKYCVEQDYGYSNYTVEGTTVDCLLTLNPNFPVDRFYDEEPTLNFAESCKRFSKGNPVSVDVDEEECGDFYDDSRVPLHLAYSKDPEIQELLKGWSNYHE